MAEGTRRRRSGQETPQRVEEAARNMNQASSGFSRGYVPQPTGANRPVNGNGAPPNGYGPAPGYPQGYPPGYPQGQPTQRQQAYPQGQPMQPQQAYPQQNGPQAFYDPRQATRRSAAPRQQTGQQNTAGWNGQAMDTGAMRGFRTAAQPVVPQKKKRKKTGWLVALALVLVGGIAAGGVFAVQNYQRNKQLNDKVTPYNNLFCPGVYVDGIDLGGMTTEQAMNSVQSRIQQRHDAWKVNLVYNGSTVAEINADMLGMSVDPAEVMNEAWQQGHTGTIEERYEQMLLLEESPYQAYTAKPSGNTSVIDNLLSQIKSQIDTPATDAVMTGFDPNQAYPFNFTDEAYGLSLDTEPVKEKLYRMVSTMESGTVELTPTRIEPSVRKADLMRHYMLRSSVTTPISKDSPDDRNDNIRRAFEIINGYQLQPGKTFSFNGVVGERTPQNGFLQAIEYVYGEHVVGYGGGVCQASTTIYQAAVCAGLQIVERKPHSDSVSYTDYGKDATVYWVGKRIIDLKFKNNTDEPIYIVASVETDPSNKKRLIAKVSMYGQDMGDVRYELESQIVDTLPAPFDPEYIKDKDATYVVYKDQEQSVSKAKEGYVVKSWRIQYTKNMVTERKELFTDTYEPKAERIYVGVKSRE